MQKRPLGYLVLELLHFRMHEQVLILSLEKREKSYRHQLVLSSPADPDPIRSGSIFYMH